MGLFSNGKKYKAQPTVIEEYLKDYEEAYAALAAVTNIIEEQCRSVLNTSKIPANVSSRTKDPRRLETKLNKANPSQNFKQVGDIQKFIQDVIGVRVTLYFPSQIQEVVAKLKCEFATSEPNVKEIFDNKSPPTVLMDMLLHDKSMAALDFPLTEVTDHLKSYTVRYGTYEAIHLRMTAPMPKAFPKGIPKKSKQKLANIHLKTEIQIQTVLRNAWSEVEHDLSYKTLSGELSAEEQQLLDCLHGLGKLGEQVLIQLKTALRLRETKAPTLMAHRLTQAAANVAKDRYVSAFDIADHIREYIRKSLDEPKWPNFYDMGDVDDFWDFLVFTQKNSRKVIQNELQKLSKSHDVNKPIVNTLITSLGVVKFDVSQPFHTDEQNDKVAGKKVQLGNVFEVHAIILELAFRQIRQASPSDESCLGQVPVPPAWSYLRDKSGLYQMDDIIMPKDVCSILRIRLTSLVISKIKLLIQWFNAHQDQPRIQSYLNMARIRAWMIYGTQDFEKPFVWESLADALIQPNLL